MRFVLLGILALLPVLVAAPARAQLDTRDGIALQNQILELRRDLQNLRSQLGASGGSALGGARQPSYAAPPGGGNDMVASLLDRVSRLEDEMRDINGRLDEMNNTLQQQHDDLAKQIGDLSFRLDSAGVPGGSSMAPAGAAPRLAAPQAQPGYPQAQPGYPPAMSPPPGQLGAIPAAPPAPPPVAPPPTPVRRTPELAMQQGNAALARRDYAAAEAAAREVLAGPRGARAIDAQFLLAEALSGKRDYANAAVAFDDAYSRSRTGPRAQDSLLGLANSLTSLGDKRAACASLDKLKAEFPNSRQDLREPIASARGRAGCP
jgi:TolA-binding protein